MCQILKLAAERPRSRLLPMPNPNGYAFSPDPTPEDAAALIAAVERFLSDTTVAPAEADEVVSGWLRAALQEGVGTSDGNSVW
jgi:hypothetical protein